MQFLPIFAKKKSKMENTEAAKYIERIEIKGLWGRYDVDWQLHSDVNILVGENGTGKTTILEAVKNLFEILEKVSKDMKVSDYFNATLFNKVVVNFKNGIETHDFTQENEGTFRASIFYDSNSENGFSYILGRNVIDTQLRNAASILLKKYNIYHIKTFDKAIKNGTDDYKTNLDAELNRLEKEYLAYKLKIFKAALKDNKVLRANAFFNETINRLFKTTDKTLNEDDEKISFLLEDGTPINWLLLSSGEKQLLIILLTVLCQYEKPSILLMDEPEISLHLRWQYELINIIRTLNPNCQVIIATHSPSLFNHGWRDKIFWIEDIAKKKEVVHG